MKNIFSTCVYDADNRYADIHVREILNGTAFMLIVDDTSSIEESDQKVEVYLTREDMQTIINRLTAVLDETAEYASMRKD